MSLVFECNCTETQKMFKPLVYLQIPYRYLSSDTDFHTPRNPKYYGISVLEIGPVGIAPPYHTVHCRKYLITVYTNFHF
jgi:hypothetical protein